MSPVLRSSSVWLRNTSASRFSRFENLVWIANWVLQNIQEEISDCFFLNSWIHSSCREHLLLKKCFLLVKDSEFRVKSWHDHINLFRFLCDHIIEKLLLTCFFYNLSNFSFWVFWLIVTPRAIKNFFFDLPCNWKLHYLLKSESLLLLAFTHLDPRANNHRGKSRFIIFIYTNTLIISTFFLASFHRWLIRLWLKRNLSLPNMIKWTLNCQIRFRNMNLRLFKHLYFLLIILKLRHQSLNHFWLCSQFIS